MLLPGAPPSFLAVDSAERVFLGKEVKTPVLNYTGYRLPRIGYGCYYDDEFLEKTRERLREKALGILEDFLKASKGPEDPGKVPLLGEALRKAIQETPEWIKKVDEIAVKELGYTWQQAIQCLTTKTYKLLFNLAFEIGVKKPLPKPEDLDKYIEEWRKTKYPKTWEPSIPVRSGVVQVVAGLGPHALSAFPATRVLGGIVYGVEPPIPFYDDVIRRQLIPPDKYYPIGVKGYYHPSLLTGGNQVAAVDADADGRGDYLVFNEDSILYHNGELVEYGFRDKEPDKCLAKHGVEGGSTGIYLVLPDGSGYAGVNRGASTYYFFIARNCSSVTLLWNSREDTNPTIVWADNTTIILATPKQLVAINRSTGEILDRAKIYPRTNKPELGTPSKADLDISAAWNIDLDRDGSKETIVIIASDRTEAFIGYIGYLVIAGPGKQAPKPIDSDRDLVVDTVEYMNKTRKQVQWKPNKPCNQDMIYYTRIAIAGFASLIGNPTRWNVSEGYVEQLAKAIEKAVPGVTVGGLLYLDLLMAPQAPYNETVAEKLFYANMVSYVNTPTYDVFVYEKGRGVVFSPRFVLPLSFVETLYLRGDYGSWADAVKAFYEMLPQLYKEKHPAAVQVIEQAKWEWEDILSVCKEEATTTAGSSTTATGSVASSTTSASSSGGGLEGTGTGRATGVAGGSGATSSVGGSGVGTGLPGLWVAGVVVVVIIVVAVIIAVKRRGG